MVIRLTLTWKSNKTKNAAAIWGFAEDVYRGEVKVACTAGVIGSARWSLWARHAGLAMAKKLSLLFFLPRVSRASRHTLQNELPMTSFVKARGKRQLNAEV